GGGAVVVGLVAVVQLRVGRLDGIAEGRPPLVAGAAVGDEHAVVLAGRRREEAEGRAPVVGGNEALENDGLVTGRVGGDAHLAVAHVGDRDLEVAAGRISGGGHQLEVVEGVHVGGILGGHAAEDGAARLERRGGLAPVAAGPVAILPAARA